MFMAVLPHDTQQIIKLISLVNNNPNDYDLGNKVRKLIEEVYSQHLHRDKESVNLNPEAVK